MARPASERCRMYCDMQVQCLAFHYLAEEIARMGKMPLACHTTEVWGGARWYTLQHMSYRHNQTASRALHYTYVYLMLMCMGRPPTKPRNWPARSQPPGGSIVSRDNLASTSARCSVTSSSVRTCRGTSQSGDAIVQEWPRRP